ncbi:MAG TPA: peptide ABC transporter substrate-binding protein [Rhizomicrobium sp.]|nr:peptide ABC transporter substrate-binding protein [Rhizomicrobium sp.]
MKRLRALAALLAVFLAACSESPPPGHVMTLNRGNAAEVKSLDPDYIDGTWEANVVGDILTGLVTEDAAGQPIPGAATSWEVSADGKTWTFHLRKGAVWSDGAPVTAEDFVYSYRRLLNPKMAAPYAYNLWVIKNAEEVNSGKLPPEALGARAADDKTLVLTLEHPAPYLPQLLMHQTAYPVPRHIVMKLGDAWAQVKNFVGNGAYLPKEWIPNDHLTLVKNPKFYDAAHVRIQVVNYYPTQDSEAALRRLRAGELDLQSSIPAAEIVWLRKNMAQDLRMVDYLATNYLIVNCKRPPFDDKRVREAISLAYNREAVVDKIMRLGEKPAYSFVPPHMANYPGTARLDFEALSYPDRIARAQSLMRAAGYGPNHPLHTTYSTAADPNDTLVAPALQSMLKQIYIDADIVQVDTAVHYKNLQQHQFNIAGASWIADFDDATNFLDLLRTGSGNNYGQWSNPKYDALMDEAEQQPDAQKRGQILNQAEQLALDDYAIVPINFRKTRNIVQPYVKGWISNQRDFNRTRWLWIEGK